MTLSRPDPLTAMPLSGRILLAGALAALLLAGLPACAAAPGDAAAPASPTLRPYRDEADFRRALAQWRSAAEQQRAERRRIAPTETGSVMLDAAPMAAAPAAKAAPVAEAGAAADSITNVQTAGVDEGGIVKRAGDHLLILRRGRLFSVHIGGDSLQPVAAIDAYAPGSNPSGAWYDELLVSGSTVVVVGYSYARGGTEIGLFRLGTDGSLAYRATHHLRSFDYYSARNYASRLIGRQLVFYSPTLLQPFGPQPWDLLPGARRWQGQGAPTDFERILPATRIYRSNDDFDPAQPLALHNVTRCELMDADMRCEASAVLAPPGRVFYVSAGSVYVWTADARRIPAQDRPDTARRVAGAAVFRIPLDGSAPTGLKTAGMPIDQMSFLEDDSGHLNALLREGGAGEGMFGAEAAAGRMALLRVPLARFGDGSGSAQRAHYRLLPGQPGHAAQNRFIGDWLLWGGSTGGRGTAWALRYAGDADAQPLAPGHRVERIEALGPDAVLVGNDGADLIFSSLNLGRDGRARLADRHSVPAARQGETRSHGFFYRPTGAGEGLLGLPVLGPAPARRPGVYGGGQGSASVVFLRQRQLRLDPLGELKADTRSVGDDGCKASCVDWYGNARPIFLGERIVALMGYELVEGRIAPAGWREGPTERLVERRRVSFAPGEDRHEERYSPFK